MVVRVAVLLLTALSILSGRYATAQRQPTSCGRIEIRSDELSAGEADRYCRYAESEADKVHKFWGDTWNETIRIHVSSSYRISRALVPAFQGNRGFLEMPLRRARGNDGALLHEIVHIYAPGSNRFLAEGVAVYLHDKLAGNPALRGSRMVLPEFELA